MKGYEKLEQHLIHQGKVVGFYGQQLLFLLQTKERSYL